jgi:hypothetical protein
MKHMGNPKMAGLMGTLRGGMGGMGGGRPPF